MDQDQEQLHITLETVPASDGWGFVGRVMVGDHESYRTIRAFPTPQEAMSFTQAIVGDVLGAQLAGQEWRSLHDELGHAPLREDLNFGLGAFGRKDSATDAPQEQGSHNPAH